MFSEIISGKNLEAAYLELVAKFAQDSKAGRYHGIDNMKIFDHDIDSAELLAQIREELIARKPIDPALRLDIPKKNDPDKSREIFIYTVKERVKAEAIARVVLPVFERRFSERLFSYRPNKPPYLAARLFARHYRRSFARDQVLVLDLHNYSSLIDKDFLAEKVAALVPNKDALEALKLFIFNKVYDRGQIRETEQGIVQGVPLIALFANLYLSDLDFKYQKRAAFYIRVGDDLALIDPSGEKLDTIARELTADLEARGLVVNRKKLFSGPAKEKFSFLGYAFDNGRISLEKSFVRRTEAEWKSLLVYKNESPAKKDRILKSLLRRSESNFNACFQELVRDKAQVNDSEQMRKLSEKFFHILTEFYFGRYSARNRRRLESITRDLGIFPLYCYYQAFHYGRKR